MGTNKTIPDKSNFLEKFAAIENYLQGNNQSANKSSTEVKNYIEPSVPFENESMQKNVEETVIPQKIISETASSQLNCTNCGAERNLKHAFCFSCGQKYDTISTVLTTEPEPQTDNLQEPVLKCVECGTTHEKDDVFCMNCGKKL